MMRLFFILLIFLSETALSQGFIINPHRFGAAGYSSDAQAAIDRLNSEPATAYKDAIADVIDGLKDVDDLQYFDHLVFMNLDNKANAYSDVSEDHQEDMVETGTMVFTATEGVQGTGTNDEYLNTKFQPSTDGDDITDTDAVYGVYIRTAHTVAGIGYLFGARDSQTPDKSQVGIFDDNGASGELQGYHHDDGGVAEVVTTAATAGMLLYVQRDGTTNTMWLRDGGSTLATNASSQPKGGLLQREIKLFATDTEGSILFENDAEFMVWFVCSSDVDLSNFKSLLDDFKTAIDAI